MKIVADENIPLVDYYFGSLGEVVLRPGRAISRKDVLNAEIVLVRSITQVDQALLDGTSVKFVGSATTGDDHIDTVWLNQAGIQWSVAYGCNAAAVMEYVISVIAALQKMNYLTQDNLRAGIVGVGAIGRRVAEKLTALGLTVFLCDPFRLMKEDDFPGVFLEDFSDLDLITLHTPLTYEGAYPTYHLIEKNFLQRQKKNCVLINTSRGPVIHFDDLKQYGQGLLWCLDVWEHEPIIDKKVLDKALIATPHIAGYSVQSKYRGIEMIYQAAIQQGIIKAVDIPMVDYPHSILSFSNQLADWRDVVLKIYNPLLTTQVMKEALNQNKDSVENQNKDGFENQNKDGFESQNKDGFESQNKDGFESQNKDGFESQNKDSFENLNKDSFDGLRKHFQKRHEFNFVKLKDILLSVEDSDILNSILGIK
jgi:erythronate-4-phosphate dehydrogenase